MSFVDFDENGRRHESWWKIKIADEYTILSQHGYATYFGTEPKVTTFILWSIPSNLGLNKYALVVCYWMFYPVFFSIYNLLD